MAAIPYMPLYIADYLADAAHLSTVEHGAYLLLIMNYWQRGGPISSLNARLASVARMSNEDWLQIQPTIAEFFTEKDGLWHHKRIDIELGHFRAKSAQASNAGKASAQRRFNARSTPVEIPFNHTDTDTDTDTDTEEKRGATAPELPAKTAVAAIRESSAKASATPRGSRLSIEHLPLEWEGWATDTLQWNHSRCLEVFEIFHDFWCAKAGKDAVKLDWFLTWKNWCKNQRTSPSSLPMKANGAVSHTDRAIQLAEDRIRRGENPFG